MLDCWIVKNNLARIFIGSVLFFANITLVFATQHIINISEKVEPEVQIVESNDTITWQMTDIDAHVYDIFPREATTLQITFTEDNPTTGDAIKATLISTITEISVTLIDSLDDGIYPYIVEILDQDDEALTVMDATLVVFSDVNQDGNLIPSKFKGNCESVTASVSIGCIVRGTCIEKIVGNDKASITLTDLVVHNQLGDSCNVSIEALTHKFSRRGVKERLRLVGNFTSLDGNQDSISSTGYPIGSAPSITVGPLMSIPDPHFADEKIEDLDPKYSTTQLKLTLDVSLNSAIGEKVYLASSAEHEIEGSLAVELDFFNVFNDEKGNHLLWCDSREYNNAGFRLWHITHNSHGEYYDLTSLVGDISKDKGNTEGLLSRKLVPLIPATGDSVQGTCYAFLDSTRIMTGTHYYMLEDIDTEGNSTFHCDYIRAVSVVQESTSDLPSIINFCKQKTRM